MDSGASPLPPVELLALLRATGSDAERAHDALAFTTLTGEETEHAALRSEVTALVAGSLRPTDRPLVRWLLEQEVAAHEAAGHSASETLYTLVAALARYADPDDVLLLWRARDATAETRAGVDAEQALRAGVERVRRRLRMLIQRGGPRAEDARQALEWLEQGIAAGAAEDLPGYFAWSDERFGLSISGAT